MQKMEQKIKYETQSYIVNGREGYPLTIALRLWKTKYQEDYRDFQKEVIIHESLKDFDVFVQECWAKIKPMTVEEALKLPNTEDRRVYFDAIGVEKLFKELDPKLLDRQVIKKKRVRWNDSLKEYTHEFEDVYELYEMEGTKLYETNKWGSKPDAVFAVRCWCTTTNREYWLYVPKDAAAESWWSSDLKERKSDAIRAIAWTIRLDVPIGHVEKIYRQGDIIVAKIKDGIDKDVTSATTYHLTKESYLELMYSET